MTLRVGLTHPGLTKLTWMDYLLTMLRNRLRRKLGCDIAPLSFLPLILRPPAHQRRRGWEGLLDVRRRVLRLR